VRTRKQRVVDSCRDGGARSVEQTSGLDLLWGEATFSGPKTLDVRMNDGKKRQLRADTIFINTGGRPSVPEIQGIGAVPFLDSTSIMELDKLPDHLLVMGGGYIGLEFGQMFRRFGSKVTIVQRGDRLLGREDPDIADEIAKILREDGIDVFLNSEVSAAAFEEGNIRLTVTSARGEQALTGSHLLVAVGRTPNTDRLNLKAAGIETDRRGFVKVNDHLETNVPGIYALGDVKGGPQFTHISYDDFRIIRANLIEKREATTRDRLVPNTVFMDPQLGRVGLSETEAREQGLSIRVAKLPMTSVARAIEMSETRGFIKAVVDANTQQIPGCAV